MVYLTRASRVSAKYYTSRNNDVPTLLIPWRCWISFWKLLALNPLNVKYGSTVRLSKLLQPSSCYLGKKLRTAVAISTVLYPELSSRKNWGLVLL